MAMITDPMIIRIGKVVKLNHQAARPPAQFAEIG